MGWTNFVLKRPGTTCCRSGDDDSTANMVSNAINSDAGTTTVRWRQVIACANQKLRRECLPDGTWSPAAYECTCTRKPTTNYCERYLYQRTKQSSIGEMSLSKEAIEQLRSAINSGTSDTTMAVPVVIKPQPPAAASESRNSQTPDEPKSTSTATTGGAATGGVASSASRVVGLLCPSMLLVFKAL